MDTTPGWTQAKIALGEESISKGSCSRGSTQIGNMKKSDGRVLCVYFSDKSVLSSIFSTFSPRLPKSRNVKTLFCAESLKKPSEQRSKCGQKHSFGHYLGRFGFIFFLQVLAEAQDQREVKNDE